jgi:hypothetical protein
MVHAKKMMLVPYMEHNPDNSPATPIGGKMISLDHEMEGILNNRTLTESEKVLQYTEAMQRFMEYQKQYTPPNTQVAPTATTGDMGEINSEDNMNKNLTTMEPEVPDKVMGTFSEPKVADVPLAPVPTKSSKPKIKSEKRSISFLIHG